MWRGKASKTFPWANCPERTIFPRQEASSELDDEYLPPAYPMYLMSWCVVMGLKQMERHQDLRQAGHLKVWSKSMEGRVIYITHEWLSVSHPDPDRVQLSSLQSLLERLAGGQIAVEADWKQRLVYKLADTVSGEHWEQVLPLCHFWLDYSSMPQPETPGPLPPLTAQDSEHSPVRPARCCRGEGPRGFTLLHWAAWAGNAGVLRALLDAGHGDSLDAVADNSMPDLAVHTGMTPLHCALSSARGTFDAAAVLLDARADPQLTFDRRTSPLHQLAGYGNAEMLRKWFERFPDTVDPKDSTFGSTPLHVAITSRSDSACVIEALLRQRADIRIANGSSGRDASLLIACNSDYADPVVVKRLLEHGCSPNARTRPTWWRWWAIKHCARLVVHARHARGRRAGPVVEYLATGLGATPLHHAARQGNLGLVRLLIEARASVQCTSFGMTPLQEATMTFGNCIPEVLAELLSGAQPRADAGASVGSDRPSGTGRSQAAAA